MEVVARTGGGYLISATESEIKEIVSSVTGKRPEKIDIGQKLPAIDYAGTITKVKGLKESYDFARIISAKKDFNNGVDALIEAVEKAALIDLAPPIGPS